MEDTVTPTAFDAWTQPITLYYSNGDNFTASMEAIDFYRLYSTRLAISYGTQVGASVILLLVLLLLTRSEKRNSSIFVLNSLCLVANSLRCIFACCFLTGNLLHPYTQLSGETSRATIRDITISVTSNTFTLIVNMLVMCSLSLQVWVVCITASKLQRVVIMSITTVAALVSVGYKLAFMIVSNRATVQLVPMPDNDRLGGSSYITQAAAILIYSCVFTWKLGYAIIQRRRLNMSQFGPMQIVFIMGCQTMIIPAIFSTLQFNVAVLNEVPEIGTMVLTVVCIFLPLSAIWAGVVNDSSVTQRGHEVHQAMMNNQFGRGSSTTTATDGPTVFDKDRQTSCSTCAHAKKHNVFKTSESSPAKKRSMTEEDDMHMGREFSVHHEIALRHV